MSRASRRRHRFGFRRINRDQGAEECAGRCHDDRPDPAPPVPAAALPSRDGHTVLAASGMQSDSSKRVRGTRSKCVRLVTWVRADDWYASHPCSVVEELAIVDTSVSFVSPCAASTSLRITAVQHVSARSAWVLKTQRTVLNSLRRSGTLYLLSIDSS